MPKMREKKKNPMTKDRIKVTTVLKAEAAASPSSFPMRFARSQKKRHAKKAKRASEKVSMRRMTENEVKRPHAATKGMTARRIGIRTTVRATNKKVMLMRTNTISRFGGGIRTRNPIRLAAVRSEAFNIAAVANKQATPMT
jgi:hypothetical protein